MPNPKSLSIIRLLLLLLLLLLLMMMMIMIIVDGKQADEIFRMDIYYLFVMRLSTVKLQ
jgi:hypothetical protein